MRKEAALRQHCDEVGRAQSEIERTFNVGPMIIRDTREEAVRVLEQTYARNGEATVWAGRTADQQPTGSPEHVAEVLAPFVAAGYRHVVCGFPSPYDAETMERLVTEVKPMLAREVGAAV